MHSISDYNQLEAADTNLHFDDALLAPAFQGSSRTGQQTAPRTLSMTSAARQERTFSSLWISGTRCRAQCSSCMPMSECFMLIRSGVPLHGRRSCLWQACVPQCHASCHTLPDIGVASGCRDSWHRDTQLLHKLRWGAVGFANVRHWGFTNW